MNIYWYWLCNLDRIGSRKIKTLLEVFETPQNVYNSTNKELDKVPKLSSQDKKTILSRMDLESIKKEYNKLKEKHIRFISIEDREYPNQLKHIYDKPYGLYYKGEIMEQDAIRIAIVGARVCTTYGSEIARVFARDLSMNGVQIISGMASGIDSYAHRGALEGKGATIAVLGCGVNICYPQENLHLMMKIETHGTIISEYSPNILPKPAHFPMRNRIISGMADGVLVIEAKSKSGSLITADMGLEQGKDIFAIPGRIGDVLSQGTNNLIKLGAKLVTNADEILEEYNILRKEMNINNKKNNKLLEREEKIVYACLSLNPKSIDLIVKETGISIQETMRILINLEFKNIIKQIGNNYYIITLA